MNKKAYLSILLASLLTAGSLAIPAYAAEPVYGSDQSINVSDKTSNSLETGKCGEQVQYELNNDGTLVISGTGDMYSDVEVPRLFKNRTDIKSVVIKKGVTSISNSAFMNCKNLTSVSIADSVKTIGESAFEKCSSLQKVDIPNGVETIGYAAFGYCSGITDVNIPDSVVSMEESAFIYALNLKNVKIGNGIKKIEPAVFCGCTNLEKIEIPDSVEEIGTRAFSECNRLVDVKLGNSLKSIGEHAFNYCTNMKNINIPNSVEIIEERAFEDCDSIVSVNIPSGVKKIGSGAFSYCRSIKEFLVDENNEYYSSQDGILFNKNKTTLIKYPEAKPEGIIPDGVKELGDSAFDDCCFSSIEIPASVESIDVYGLNRSLDFKSYVVSEQNQYFSSEEGVLYDKYKTKLIAYPSGKTDKTHFLLESVVSIDDRAFSNCEYLQNLYTTDSVDEIGEEAFYQNAELKLYTYDGSYIENYAKENNVPFESIYQVGNCGENTTYNISNGDVQIYGSGYIGYPNGEKTPFRSTNGITSVDISAGVTDIGTNAFGECYDLEIISMPDGLKTIGDGAFLRCLKLKNVEIPDSVETIGANAFADCKSLKGVTIGKNVKSIGQDAFYGAEDLTLFVFAGTYAETYAKENNINYVIMDGTESGKCGDNLNYTLYDNGELYISGSGDMYNYDSDGSSNVSPFANNPKIKSIFMEGVTSIGNNAFNNCTSLEYVHISDDIKSIGDFAFANCKSVYSVWIGTQVEKIGECAFSFCKSLDQISVSPYNQHYCAEDGVLFDKNKTQLIQYPQNMKRYIYKIPEGVQSINSYAFNNCNITYIDMPESLKNIQSNTFNGCKNLNYVKIPSGVEQIAENAFTDCSVMQIFGYENTCAQKYAVNNNIVFLPLSVYETGQCGKNVVYILDGDGNLTISGEGDMYDNLYDKRSSFVCNDKITSVVVESGVTSIGEFAFYSCKNLKNIDISQSVNSIGWFAFCYCTSLDEIELPYYITTLNKQTFENCCNLKSVKFNGTVTNIEEGAFFNCENLSSIDLNEGLEHIGNMAFSFCTGLSDIVLPNSLKDLGDEAFSACLNLKNVLLGENLNSIASYAFAMTDISSILIPESVTKIGDGAFFDCTELTSITIPASVIEIGNYAFYRCDNIVVHGYKNSYAETYANSNNLKFLALDETVSGDEPSEESSNVSDNKTENSQNSSLGGTSGGKTDEKTNVDTASNNNIVESHEIVNTDKGSVQTGDNGIIPMLFALTAAISGAVLVLLKCRRKTEK